MSETKKPKQKASETKKSAPTKAKSEKKEADKAPVTPEPSSSDSTKEKAKSASQASISHFSSVSTPEYRTGWDSIFGGSKSAEKSSKNSSAGNTLPEQLIIEDDDIDEQTRSVLYKAIQRQARKQGLSLAKSKNRVELSYTLRCDVRAK